MINEVVPKHFPTHPDHPLDRFATSKADLVQVSQANFPALLAAHSEYARTEETHYYAWRFRSEPQQLPSLLAGGESIPIGELVYRQHLIQYPSHQVIPVEPLPQGRTKEDGQGPWITEKDMALQNAKRRKANSDDVAWEFGAKTKTPDLDANTYLALRILLDKTIATPSDLEAHIQDHGEDLSVDYDVLRNGFVSLVTRKTSAQIRSSPAYGTIPADQWLAGTAAWISYCTDKLMRVSGDQQVSPMPVWHNMHPEVEFIPYMLEAHLDMLVEAISRKEHRHPAIARKLIFMTEAHLGMAQEAIYDRILYFHLLHAVGNLGETQEGLREAIQLLFSSATDDQRERILTLQEPVGKLDKQLREALSFLSPPKSEPQMSPAAFKARVTRLQKDTKTVRDFVHLHMAEVTAKYFH